MGFNGHKNIAKFDGSTPESWFTYVCAHCGTKVTGATVGSYQVSGRLPVKWLLCTNCENGSVYCNDGNVFPGSTFGPDIQGLPDGVKEAYNEARQCLSVNALTACELICRKILMHVAVEKGAKEGDQFAAYLSYLEASGYVTPPMKAWVDLIRQHGNKATHRLQTPERKRAESTLMFTAELLRLIYEMEYIANQYLQNP